ncbi:MAG TPA: acetyl-CoA carboxylase biotin carboxylase subunit, partial [Vicinamibacteria bacterium]
MSARAFGTVLVANRGEIAVRVIRACREMGIRSVAVFSEADREALHVRLADAALPIGPAPSRESYLSIDRVLAAARASGADAVHPGYGFLAENAAFARACEEAGIAFIGPRSATIALMGEKTSARREAVAAGVPVVPGTLEPIADERALAREAERIGYPVMLKAAAGGGGKGLRLVATPAGLLPALARARSEAKGAFGDESVYLEKAVARPRHVEIQVLADHHGNAVHLFERECSIQRRHQKVVEESPSPLVTPELRERMGALAVALVRRVGYVNAGTLEFLVDADRNPYFLEMNTRLQVEHPVTEMVTGVDLVQQQIRIAQGEPLPFRQEDLTQRGHAIECRVYAEDPDNGFLPSPGRIVALRPPGGPGVRDDSGVCEGGEVGVHYDPLVSKLVAWGESRDEAIRRMRRAVAEYRIV